MKNNNHEKDSENMHIDLKDINDTLGLAAGGEALKAVGDMLQKEIRKSSVYARIKSEEFSMLVCTTNHEILFKKC